MSAAPATRIIELPNIAATQALAASVAGVLRAGDAILLDGPLGAGKTEFARALLRSLTGDASLDVPSPSFTLIQEYETRIGPISHFDLWRLNGPTDLSELGWEEAREGVVLVEWPDRLGALRPADALTIALHPVSEAARRAVLSGWADRIGRIA
jgi:tRNA threonylcarbamoyladenosine biosynthesis protein TsaE